MKVKSICTSLLVTVLITLGIESARAAPTSGEKLIQALQPHLDDASGVFGTRSRTKKCKIESLLSDEGEKSEVLTLLDAVSGEAYASVVIAASVKGTVTTTGEDGVTVDTYLLKHPTTQQMQLIEIKTYEDDPSFTLSLGVKKSRRGPIAKYSCAISL